MNQIELMKGIDEGYIKMTPILYQEGASILDNIDINVYKNKSIKIRKKEFLLF